jgi:hypothetical protein
MRFLVSVALFLLGCPLQHVFRKFLAVFRQDFVGMVRRVDRFYF